MNMMIYSIILVQHLVFNYNPEYYKSILLQNQSTEYMCDILIKKPEVKIEE